MQLTKMRYFICIYWKDSYKNKHWIKCITLTFYQHHTSCQNLFEWKAPTSLKVLSKVILYIYVFVTAHSPSEPPMDYLSPLHSYYIIWLLLEFYNFIESESCRSTARSFGLPISLMGSAITYLYEYRPVYCDLLVKCGYRYLDEVPNIWCNKISTMTNWADRSYLSLETCFSGLMNSPKPLERYAVPYTLNNNHISAC